MTTYDVTLGGGLIQLATVAGDHVGFTSAFPLSRRRKLESRLWWEASTSDAAGVVAWAEARGLTVDPALKAYAANLWKDEASRLATATAIHLDGSPMPTVEGLTATLLETQQVVVSASPNAWYSPPGQTTLCHRAILLADDQGLGKSLTALACLRVAGSRAARAVIVCPTSLTQNWAAEMGAHFEATTFTPYLASSKTPESIPAWVDVVIIGWDVLTFWAETLIEWTPDAVIADEGHYAKSGKQTTRTTTEPKRTAGGDIIFGADGLAETEKVTKVTGGTVRATALLDIGRAVSKAHGLILPMSGTPMVNRPLELLPLIEFAGALKLFVSDTEFKNRYCGPTTTRIGGGRTAKEYKGATNLLELNTRLLVSGLYVRRTKEVLVDQGLLQRKYVDGVYAFDHETPPRPWVIAMAPEDRAVYETARGATQDFFLGRAQEIAAEKRMGINTVYVANRVAAEGAKHLRLITELRQVAARLKVPTIIDRVARKVEQGEKVVIAAHHREIVTAYADAFGGLRIQGDMGVKAIEEAKALFNGTPVTENPVLVLSVDAGKTGHTLCKQRIQGVGPACAFMVLAEQLWTPGDESQVQDRVWRIGQDREVHISNALLEDSIDFTIFEQRWGKRRVLNAVLDAVDPSLLASAYESGRAEKSGAGRIAQQLVYGTRMGAQT